MAIDTTELIQGPANLWIAPFGSTEPAETAVALAGDPSTPWTNIGITTDGTKVSIMQEFSKLKADQIVEVPGRRLTERDVEISTNVAQPTLENLANVMNAGTVDTTITGVKKLKPATGTSATQPAYRALIVDGFAPQQRRRRIVVRKVLSTDNVEFAYQKEDQTVFSVKWNAHYVSPSVDSFVVLDENPA